MHCRAYWLLEREYLELKEENPYGITAFPLSNDLLKWVAEIKGQKKSIWEGCKFPLVMKFSPDYNYLPPAVAFNPVPFHPNVDPTTGKPSMDFLDDPNAWDRNHTLKSILLSIQEMLSYPTLHDPINLEAAQMIIDNKILFKDLALKSMSNPPIISELDSEEDVGVIYIKSPEEIATLSEKSIKGISFDEYYKTWSGIATTQTNNGLKIPVTHDPNLMEHFIKWKSKQKNTNRGWDAKFHSIMTRIAQENRLPTKLDRSLIQSIKSAQINTTPDLNILGSEDEEEHVPKRRKSKKRTRKSKAKMKTKSPQENDDDAEEAWEKEVENLVAWTNKLSTTALED
ncbi:ubiquitin-conjugating enzyme E2 U [Monodelphis domestica]|uniref:ubiquitin-conjugating enzyme E2 U n=1 Tax=Monodelphis domestica TaxID=13616 RepID=UPI00028BDA47|nr:ubiquitin-conjugating enzyme E2 U [Monodelphis domestica]